MTEYTPTTETVRERFIDGAIYRATATGLLVTPYSLNRAREDFDRWLAQHDAELRAEAAEAEVERLREDYRAACEARMVFHDELDEAQRQLADLRAGIEAAVVTLNREVYRQPTPWIDRLANRLCALLAGPGEQPGEGRGPVRDGWCCWTCADLAAAADPAPVVPASADVRERVRTEFEYRLRTTAAYYRMRGKRGEQPEEGWIEREIDAATDAVLAVVDQGAAADRATRANRSSFDLAMRPYRADVRPSGQEGS